MSARPFRDLCPEADERDAMSDDEFWAHVYPNPQTAMFDGSDLDASLGVGTCDVCGSDGACGYDAEGRALIHVSDEQEER